MKRSFFLHDFREKDQEFSSASPDSPAFFLHKITHLLLHRTDYVMLIPAILLLVIGVLFIYGTGQQTGGFAAVTFWKRHLHYMALGGGIFLLFSLLDYRWCGPASAVFYIFSLLLLALVPFFGVKYFGARSWLQIGSLNFQPSELVKFSLILLSSWLLSMRKTNVNNLLHLSGILLLMILPVVLTVLQPDLGTAITMIVPLCAVIFVAKLKWRYICIIAVSGILLGAGTYVFGMKTYQKERIKVFLDPGRDPRNRGWNQLQAEMAVGSGGLTGKGFMNGTHNLLGYLPQKVANSDFIFPVIAEETGFLGAGTLVILFILILLAILRTALLAPDDFGRYLCTGIAILLFFHIYINIAMSIRLSPVTGLPLPLVSYGGTFLVTTMAYLGIVHSVYGHREKKSIFNL